MSKIKCTFERLEGSSKIKGINTLGPGPSGLTLQVLQPGAIQGHRSAIKIKVNVTSVPPAGITYISITILPCIDCTCFLFVNMCFLFLVRCYHLENFPYAWHISTATISPGCLTPWNLLVSFSLPPQWNSNIPKRRIQCLTFSNINLEKPSPTSAFSYQTFSMRQITEEKFICLQ